jgi:hypothetical protein
MENPQAAATYRTLSLPPRSAGRCDRKRTVRLSLIADRFERLAELFAFQLDVGESSSLRRFGRGRMELGVALVQAPEHRIAVLAAEFCALSGAVFALLGSVAAITSPFLDLFRHHTSVG